MRTFSRRVVAYLILALMSVGIMLITSMPAAASESGRRNTAWALSGISAYQLFKGNTGTGLVTGAGALYAWQRANEAERDRHYSYYRNNGYGYYQNPYNQYGYNQYGYNQPRSGYYYYPNYYGRG